MKWLITTVVVLAVAALGVAFYRNWIVVERSAATPGNEATQINITVDRAKAREDLQDARESTGELVQKARKGAENLVSSTTLKGEIMAVNAAQNELTLKADGQDHVVRVDKDADIQRDKTKAGFDTLKAGEQATVKVKEENGVKVAHSIMITQDN